MKKIFTLFLLLQLSTLSFSQENLPVDENGRYTFYEVVELKDFTRKDLLDNAEKFLEYYINKRYRKEITKDTAAGKISGHSSFLVYKKGSLGKNVDGAIEYNIEIEVKDNKYRYLINDFIFQEYQRNRYGKFEPVKGKTMNLEEPVSDLNKWQWDAHKETVREKMDTLISELKTDMLKRGEEEQKKVKVKKEW